MDKPDVNKPCARCGAVDWRFDAHAGQPICQKCGWHYEWPYIEPKLESKGDLSEKALEDLLYDLEICKATGMNENMPASMFGLAREKREGAPVHPDDMLCEMTDEQYEKQLQRYNEFHGIENMRLYNE